MLCGRNLITELAGLSTLANLRTLNVSDNQLGSIGSLDQLLSCPSINNLDLSNNKIDCAQSAETPAVHKCVAIRHALSAEEEDPWALLELFATMPELRTLLIQENPILSLLPRLRKNFVSRLEKLNYLNDQPVGEEERLCAEVPLPALTSAHIPLYPPC